MPTSTEGLSLRQFHRVFVFDPTGESAPFLAFAHQSKREAVAWVRNWELDPLNHAAVLWPIGAKPPKHYTPKAWK